MAQIQIVFVDPSGKELKFSLPNDKPIERMLMKISQGLCLTGSISDYKLLYASQELDVSSCFQQLEIGEGAIIHVVKAIHNPINNPLSEVIPSSSSGDYYVAQPNAKWPALIIFIIDVSGSMGYPLGSETRIKIVENVFKGIMRVMIRRSMRGSVVSPRYKVALLTYSDTVVDVYKGIHTIAEVAGIGYPTLHTNNYTNTREAFIAARNLLKAEIGGLQSGIPGSKDGTYPAPLVCHLTDGFYTEKYGDPGPIVDEIKKMSVPDGHVLVENIFILESLGNMSLDPEVWGGFLPDTRFVENSYAEKLLQMSSIAPESYRTEMAKSGYQLTPGSVMFYPGTSPELVRMAFQMSIATPIGDNK